MFTLLLMKMLQRLLMNVKRKLKIVTNFLLAYQLGVVRYKNIVNILCYINCLMDAAVRGLSKSDEFRG